MGLFPFIAYIHIQYDDFCRNTNSDNRKSNYNYLRKQDIDGKTNKNTS